MYTLGKFKEAFKKLCPMKDFEIYGQAQEVLEAIVNDFDKKLLWGEVGRAWWPSIYTKLFKNEGEGEVTVLSAEDPVVGDGRNYQSNRFNKTYFSNL